MNCAWHPSGFVTDCIKGKCSCIAFIGNSSRMSLREACIRCTPVGVDNVDSPSLPAANCVQGRCGSAGATVTVTVTDLCPECGATTQGEGDHFDLNALSFNQLAPMLNGRIDVNYRLVACAPPSSLKVQVDGSGGPGLWLRLLITVSCQDSMLTCPFQACSFQQFCFKALPV